MKKRINKYVYWIPRILSILLILFLTIFSWDVFDENLGFWGTVLGLLIHNIPVIILLGILIISWKYEIVGGIAFILAGMAQIVLSLMRNTIDHWYVTLSFALILVVPAFLIGILFLVGWFKKKHRD
jgi:hypothetical protein